jgi:hypothetical protein
LGTFLQAGRLQHRSSGGVHRLANRIKIKARIDGGGLVGFVVQAFADDRQRGASFRLPTPQGPAQIMNPQVGDSRSWRNQRH